MMKKYLCGVDLGGSKLSVGIFLPDGTLVEKRLIHSHVSLDEKGIAETIINLISTLLKSLHIQDSDLYGIGIGVAGHINFEKGLIITVSNFKASFRNYPLKEIISREFDTPVYLDNDANAQAYGELKFGWGKEYSHFVFTTVSTGVGCGIIIDRRLIRGITGTAGELGHTIIDPHSDILCTCGNYGCLMALSSGKSLPVLYERYLKEGYRSSIGLNRKNVATLDGILLKKGIEENDEISMKVLINSADTIGTGLYNLFQILNPKAFIIGGGLTNMGDFYIERIKKRFLSLVNNMMYDTIDFKLPSLGNNAGLLGAAALTLEEKNE